MMPLFHGAGVEQFLWMVNHPMLFGGPGGDQRFDVRYCDAGCRWADRSTRPAYVGTGRLFARESVRSSSHPQRNWRSGPSRLTDLHLDRRSEARRARRRKFCSRAVRPAFTFRVPDMGKIVTF